MLRDKGSKPLARFSFLISHFYQQRKRKRMLMTLCAIVRNLRRDEEGATMVEYGLLIALIAMVALAGITLLGGNLQTLYTTVAGSV